MENYIRRAKKDDAEGIHLAHMRSIRELCSKDYNEVQVAAWGGRDFDRKRRLSDIQNDIVFVVEIDGKIEGFSHMGISPNGGSANLYGLYFTKKAAGKGLGKKLLGLMEEEVMKLSVNHIKFHSTLTSLGFYKKHDYVVTSEETSMDINGVPIPCIPMEKVFWTPPTLQTDRLILRPIVESDVDDIFAYACNPNVSQYTMWDSHESIQDSKDFISAYIIPNYKLGVPEPLGVICKESSLLIGTVGCFYSSRKNKTMELAYALSERFWGQGIVCEASQELLRYVSKHFDFHRMQARCMAENAPSARVMEKLGLSYEGVQRGALFHRGRYWDMKYYSILRSEILERIS